MIVTERLELVLATPELVRAAMEGERALEKALHAKVPSTWPHEYLDTAALQYTLDRLAEERAPSGWWFYFVVLVADGERALIGSAGFKGPPSADGTVELGYGIVSDRRRRGFASEAVRGMLAHAFAVPTIRRVLGETLPELTASIGVLETCGFHLTDGGSEPGVIRFEITRAEHDARRAAKTATPTTASSPRRAPDVRFL